MFGGLGAAGGDWHQARPLLGPPRLGLGAPSRVPVLLGSDTVWGRVWPCVRLPRCTKVEGAALGAGAAALSLPPSRGTAGAGHGQTHLEPGVTQLLPSPQPAPSRTSVSLGGPRETIPRGKAETGSEHPASPAPSQPSRPPWRVLQQPRAVTF